MLLGRHGQAHTGLPLPKRINNENACVWAAFCGICNGIPHQSASGCQLLPGEALTSLPLRRYDVRDEGKSHKY